MARRERRASHLNGLIADAMHLIFHHLDPKDLQPARAVSKRFRMSVDSCLFQELVLKPIRQDVDDDREEPDYVRCHRWYSTAQFVNRRNIFFHLPEGEHLNTVLLAIRRLRVAIRFNASALIRLAQDGGVLHNLQHLEIVYLVVDEPTRLASAQQHLPLANLQVLRVDAVEWPDYDQFRLIFDSPILNVLCLGDANANYHIRVSNPMSVTSFEFGRDVEDAIYTYRNVQTVTCHDVENLAPGPIIDHLFGLNTLTELHLLDGQEISSSDWLSRPSVIAFRSICLYLHQRSLATQYLNTNRMTRRVYFMGVLIDTYLTPVLLNQLADPMATVFEGLCQSPLLELHYTTHDDRIARTFPICSTVRLDEDFMDIMDRRPELISRLATFLRSTYPCISELQIEVASLIPELIEVLSGPGQISERINRLYAAIQDPNLPPAELPLTSENRIRNRLKLKLAINQLAQLPGRLDQLDLLAFRAINPRLYGLGERWVLQLVASFPHLACLDLRYSGFSQYFYDELARSPRLTDSLNKLVVLERESSSLVTDPQFLFRFQKLNHLFSNQLIGEHALQFVESTLNSAGLFHLVRRVDNGGVERVGEFRITKHRGPHRPLLYDLWYLEAGPIVRLNDITFDELNRQLLRDERFNLFGLP